jgi:hypothetical protein
LKLLRGISDIAVGTDHCTQTPQLSIKEPFFLFVSGSYQRLALSTMIAFPITH